MTIKLSTLDIIGIDNGDNGHRPDKTEVLRTLYKIRHVVQAGDEEFTIEQRQALADAIAIFEAR